MKHFFLLTTFTMFGRISWIFLINPSICVMGLSAINISVKFIFCKCLNCATSLIYRSREWMTVSNWKPTTEIALTKLFRKSINCMSIAGRTANGVRSTILLFDSRIPLTILKISQCFVNVEQSNVKLDLFANVNINSANSGLWAKLSRFNTFATPSNVS